MRVVRVATMRLARGLGPHRNAMRKHKRIAVRIAGG
jgi:hypothetical protein